MAGTVSVVPTVLLSTVEKKDSFSSTELVHLTKQNSNIIAIKILTAAFDLLFQFCCQPFHIYRQDRSSASIIFNTYTISYEKFVSAARLCAFPNPRESTGIQERNLASPYLFHCSAG